MDNQSLLLIYLLVTFIFFLVIIFLAKWIFDISNSRKREEIQIKLLALIAEKQGCDPETIKTIIGW